MSGMIAHLKRRNMKKIYEQEGSLPQIPYKKMQTVGQTAESKSQVKPVFRYISQVTFNSEDQSIDSPQQLVAQKQYFFMSQNNNSSSNGQRNLSVQETQVPAFRQQKNYQSKQSSFRVAKKQAYQRSNHAEINKRPVVKPKQSLQQILMHKNRFIRKYFEDIHQQLQK